MKSLLQTRHFVACAVLTASGLAIAADGPPAAGTSAPQHRRGMMGNGMMGQGMMGDGMKDMMRSCQSMMGNGANMGGIAMPGLPAGNEKLEAQMHAEMLQKMGEIAARYAERIKDSR